MKKLFCILLVFVMLAACTLEQSFSFAAEVESVQSGVNEEDNLSQDSGEQIASETTDESVGNLPQNTGEQTEAETAGNGTDGFSQGDEDQPDGGDEQQVIGGKVSNMFTATQLLETGGGNKPDNFAELTVTKSFEGLTAEKMEALKDTYEIAITDSNGAGVKTLTLSDSNVSLLIENDVYTYTWIMKLEADNYTLTEFGYGVQGYSCTATASVDDGAKKVGNSAVAVLKAPAYGDLEFFEYRHPNCQSTTIGIDSVFICLSFTGSAPTGYKYIIWTQEQLTEDVYKLLLQYITSASGVGPFNSMTATNTIYWAGDASGFSYPDQTYSDTELVWYLDEQNFLNIQSKSTWNQLLFGDLSPFLDLFTSEVDFVNTYSPKGNLEISKTVKGSAANPNEHFTFALESEELNGTFDVSYTGTDGCSDTHPASVIFVDGKATISLKHGETMTIEDIPIGTVVTVTETSGGNYDTYINGEMQNSAAVTIAGGDNSLAFENKLEPPVVTGIIKDTAPYIILAVIVLVCMGVFAAVHYRKTKKNKEVWNE